MDSKGVEKMGIKNLTEAEEKEFYRLVEKMNGKEPDKKQDVKVRKPEYGQEYFFANSHGWVECDTWRDTAVDNKRWEFGNVFLIREKALFDVEKRRVEVELERLTSLPVSSSMVTGPPTVLLKFNVTCKLLCFSVLMLVLIQSTFLSARLEYIFILPPLNLSQA